MHFSDQAWVRKRCREAGLPPPESVHLVSSTKQQGVDALLKQLAAVAGPRGDVWVVRHPHKVLCGFLRYQRLEPSISMDV